MVGAAFEAVAAGFACTDVSVGLAGAAVATALGCSSFGSVFAAAGRALGIATDAVCVLGAAAGLSSEPMPIDLAMRPKKPDTPGSSAEVRVVPEAAGFAAGAAASVKGCSAAFGGLMRSMLTVGAAL